MADYDTPGLTYDSGVLYDAVSPPLPTKRMAKVKLNLREKSDSDVMTFAQQHVTAMTGNANFATPLPAATAFAPVLTAYQTALAAFNTAQQAAKQATTVKDAARAALELALTQRGNYVDLIAAGNAAVIESSGFSVKASSVPAGVPGQVQNLSLTAGDHDGELNAQWDPVAGAKSYEIATSPDPVTTTSWTKLKSVTKSTAVITGLTSGSRIWTRVRAIGASGEGNWSDPATKIVP
jgi:hypothetical protein